MADKIPPSSRSPSPAASSSGDEWDEEVPLASKVLKYRDVTSEFASSPPRRPASPPEIHRPLPKPLASPQSGPEVPERSKMTFLQRWRLGRQTSRLNAHRRAQQKKAELKVVEEINDRITAHPSLWKQLTMHFRSRHEIARRRQEIRETLAFKDDGWVSKFRIRHKINWKKSCRYEAHTVGGKFERLYLLAKECDDFRGWTGDLESRYAHLQQAFFRDMTSLRAKITPDGNMVNPKHTEWAHARLASMYEMVSYHRPYTPEELEMRERLASEQRKVAESKKPRLRFSERVAQVLSFFLDERSPAPKRKVRMRTSKHTPPAA